MKLNPITFLFSHSINIYQAPSVIEISPRVGTSLTDLVEPRQTLNNHTSKQIIAAWEEWAALTKRESVETRWCYTPIPFLHIYSPRSPKREVWAEGIVRELGIDMYTLLYLKWITVVRTYCIAQGTLLNVIWQPRWEGRLGENGYMHIYG